jgi:hypothetical protein
VFIELVGSLRCVHEHALSWLVASAYRMEDRDIVSGELGCHICGARYSVEDGVADFRELGAEATPASPLSRAAAGMRAPYDAAPEELALRVAALMELASPGGVVVLAGSWSSAAASLASGDVGERVHVLTLDPAVDVVSGRGISIALTARRPPLRPATVRGIALDAAHASIEYASAAAESLRPGARLIAPLDTPLPAGLAEVARDSDYWLAEKGRGVRVELKRR